NTEPLAETAIESLAASRFSAAHQALLEILKNEPPASRLRIVEILARHPRPVWSETIYEYVTAGGMQPTVEGLRALIRIGHPELRNVLEQSLSSGSTAARNEAFNVLSAMNDSQAEEIALAHTLKHLENSPPTPQMTQLLHRTRDPRAVPPLLKLLEKDKGSQSQIIMTLSQIGDQTVTTVLEKLYPEFEEQEKAVALGALLQLHSPRFRTLAREAITSDNGSLINTACRGLQQDGSAEAVKILTDALASRDSKASWSYVINALGVLGTPEARTALQEARESGDENVRAMATNGLKQMQQRSPGYQYMYQAQQHLQQEKWEEAIEMYSVAVEVDPQLSEAWSGRGNARLKQDKTEAARGDFTQALKIDSWDAQAVTGLAICLVADGKLDSGLKYVEDARRKFDKDMTFAFNTACVYSRALAWVEEHKDADERERRIEEYRAKALAELKRSVELGFRQFDWMRKDPDLKPLEGLKEFKEIHTPSTSAVQPRPGKARAARPVQVQINQQLVP
ncbi:MAG: tetratricopeptide repeat protein, partial [Planctomycetaceae bacterium]|nr:tetratricopeptide repeat protein [Planctomycetaceae bacterium]